MKLESAGRIFEKNFNTSNVMKITPVGAELSHGDGRTDDEADAVPLCNFANALKNEYAYCLKQRVGHQNF